MFEIHYNLVQIFLSRPVLYNPLTLELFKYLCFKILSANEILVKIPTNLTDKNSTVWVETGLDGPAAVHHSGLPFGNPSGLRLFYRTTTKN